VKEFLAILAALLAYDLTKLIGRALQRWYLRMGERVPLTTGDGHATDPRDPEKCFISGLPLSECIKLYPSYHASAQARPVSRVNPPDHW
jgi:hypothetical protein